MIIFSDDCRINMEIISSDQLTTMGLQTLLQIFQEHLINPCVTMARPLGQPGVIGVLVEGAMWFEHALIHLNSNLMRLTWLSRIHSLFLKRPAISQLKGTVR